MLGLALILHWLAACAAVIGLLRGHEPDPRA